MFASLIVFLPLIAAAYVGLSVRIIGAHKAEWVTTAAVMLAACFSYVTFYSVVIEKEIIHITLMSWMQIGKLDINWAIYVDSLTASMFVLVNTVSALVHLYSIGYMHEDEHRQRFMCYLSLFTFFMLVLVSGDNFVQMFVGWEGVGLCSYLLIGFWYKKGEANAAAMKAFLVNRVGDLGLMLGLGAIFLFFGSLNYADVFFAAPAKTEFYIDFFGYSIHGITLICLLLFIGCMGKSAQLGLHTWLPDAMEGPTPVSALIHAATMVTAGVFLVARCSPLFEHSELALSVVTIVGATTAFFAATIALTQTDIKRVIAYSTCSQLGYMFFACGVSAYSAGVFHLLTHGFFKALLFLCAGSVIHALHHEQDLRNMGGLWKKIPYTYGFMLVGTLAITGFPLLSGFYSKDMILESAFAAAEHGNSAAAYAFWLGIGTALLTSLYSWRLIFMAFHGTTRLSKSDYSHVHESPNVILIPLAILTMGALVVGALGYYALDIVDAGLAYWNGAIFMAHTGEHSVLEAAHHVPSWVKLAPMVTMASGFALAYLLYILRTDIPSKLATSMAPLYRMSFRKWYIDELYDRTIVRPLRILSFIAWRVGDVMIIDGLGPNGAARMSQLFGKILSRAQSGFLYHYALVMLVALLAIVNFVILV